MDLSLPINTVENITENDFLEQYFYPQKPVIIKGLVSGTPSENWTLSYLKEKLGNTPVSVFDNQRKHDSAYTFGDLEMPFSNFIDIIARDAPCPYRLFLFNGFKHSPELKQDFPCPSIFRGILDHIGLMFFGGKSTDVRTHFDIDGNNVLHTQFIGKKRILLFAPHYSELLYKVPFGTYSIAGFADPDYERFPALRYVKGYDVILNPGDSLFMPAGYWHYMRYLEGGFAVTYRKMAHKPENNLSAFLHMSFYLWIDKCMSFVCPDYWLDYKQKIARDRANAAMEKIEAEEGNQLARLK
jgi:hypothetical protein